MSYDWLRPSKDSAAGRRMQVRHLTKMGMNFDQQVHQYKDVPAKRVYQYRVRRVVSPFEFYLELADHPEEKKYTEWFPEMNVFYEDPGNRQKLELFKGILLPGRCYACYSAGAWHRVRLHRHQKNANTVIVYYLDLLKLQETKAENLLELEPSFAQYLSHVFPAYLHDIGPAGDANSVAWSDQACQHFKKLVEGKQFTGIVLTRSNQLVSSEMPDVIPTLGVVLLENIPNTERPIPGRCTVNAGMVDAGYAVARGPCAGCQHTLQVNQHRDPPVAIPSPPNGDGKEEETTAPVEEAGEEPASSELIFPSDYYKNASNNIPEEFISSAAAVHLAYITSPSNIVVHLKSKQGELQAMQESLSEFLQQDDHSVLTDGEAGMLVACHILDQNWREVTERIIWVRGLITARKIDEETERVKYDVILADYGNEVIIDHDFVAPLPPDFQTIPCFALRIHLDVEGVIPTTQPEDEVVSTRRAWSCHADEYFRSYAFVWEVQSPTYFVYREGQAEVLKLQYFEHPVEYDLNRGKWTAPPVDTPDVEGSKAVLLHRMREHPIVRSLFVSVGVNLVYEVVMEETPFWHFESVVDSLVFQEHAVDSGVAEKSSNRLHVEITEAAMSSRLERDPALLPVPKSGSNEESGKEENVGVMKGRGRGRGRGWVSK